MSSKGQVVIPAEMRKYIKDGEKFVVIQNKRQLILERTEDFRKNIEEDLLFAKRTEEAWKKYDKGRFITRDAGEFLKEIKEWKG